MTTEVHPEFAAHGSFAHLKLGRKPKRDDPRTLKLAKYLDDAVLLPTIPPTFNLMPQVASWPMFGNDSLGDCTCAAAGHLIQAWSASAGAEKTPTEQAVEALYWETGDPPSQTGTAGGPTDDGRDEISLLNYWHQNGLGGDEIAAYAAVDPSNHDHLRAALYLFGGLYTGIELPQTAQSQPEWDVVGDGRTGPSAPGSWGGHAVPYLPVWDGAKLSLVTWGAVLEATLGFHDAYTDELYAVISNDFLASGKTPQGFDLEALQADLSAIGQTQAPVGQEQLDADVGTLTQAVSDLTTAVNG